MNLRKTLLLGVVLLSAIFYIFRVHLPHQTEVKAKEFLWGITSPQSVSQIEIEGKNGNFGLKNRNPKPEESTAPIDPLAVTGLEVKDWEIAAIPGSELENSSVSALTNALLGLRLGNALPKDEIETDLSVYGLAQPELVVRMTLGTRKNEIKFGKLSEYLNKRYVQIAGASDIYLVEPSVFDSANKKSSDFRNKNLFSFVDSELQQVKVSSSAGDVEISLGSNFRWNLSKPSVHKASGEEVSTWLRDIRGITVNEFFDAPGDAPSRESIENTPDATLTIGYKEGSKRPALEIKFKKQTIELPSSEPGKETEKKKSEALFYVITGRPSIFRFNENALPKIVRSADSLREHQLFQFVTDQVIQLDSEGSDVKALTLSKDGDAWKVNGKSSDVAFVEQLIRDLSEVRAVSFSSAEGDYGFNNPRLKVLLKLKSQISGSEGATPGATAATPTTQLSERTLVVGNLVQGGATAAKSYYAAVDQMKEPFIIDEASYRKIAPREETLVKVGAASSPTVAKP